MASELFYDLYLRAFRRQHPLFLRWQWLSAKLGTRDVSHLITLATELIAIDDEFDNRMRQVRHDNRIRLRKIMYHCPFCHQENCPGAVEVVPAAAGSILQHLLAGGQPYTYEEE